MRSMIGDVSCETKETLPFNYLLFSSPKCFNDVKKLKKKLIIFFFSFSFLFLLLFGFFEPIFCIFELKQTNGIWWRMCKLLEKIPKNKLKDKKDVHKDGLISYFYLPQGSHNIFKFISSFQAFLMR